MSKDLFFVGPEVEHTPAATKRTLFVVGKQKLDQILTVANEHKTPHIRMGVNHSFSVESLDPYWDHVITALLDKGFWVTLDYPADNHNVVLKMLNPGIWQSRLFVPLLGVKIPNIQTSSSNLTIKIDDIGFDETNEGVWCLHHHQATDSNRFTSWGEYATNVAVDIEGDDTPTPMPPYVTAPTDPVTKIELSSLQPATVTSNVTNDNSLGIDTEPTTALKPDPEAEDTIAKLDIIDAESAADAYAEGTTSDPLAEEESKKPKAKKK